MFAVKTSRLKDLSNKKECWVKDASWLYYVTKDKRGEWPTYDEAKAAITEKYEKVVEI